MARPAHSIVKGEHTRRLVAWALACILTGLVMVIYLSISWAAGDGDPLMPVDDAYIHFQYARQIAQGEPYVYNPGLPPSSGATSFIYPYLLALGYAIGFQGLSLGLWAVMLGALALLAGSWLIYLLVRWASTDRESGHWTALGLMSAFILAGPLSWHAMSGMETALIVAFVLLTLYGFVCRSTAVFVAGAALLALTRPEGSIMSLIAVALYGVFALLRQRHLTRDLVWLVLPVAAVGVQPLVNLLLTGSLSASGNQAKSLLSMIPAHPDVILREIVENFTQMWLQFFTGFNSEGLVFVPPLLAAVALIGLVVVARSRRRWDLPLLIVAWLLVITAAISTLDTAFWHFKRYQMPLLALFFPLAGWALVSLRWPVVRRGAVLLLAVFSLWTGVSFAGYYAQNVRSVAAQPLAMARWLQANTPPDARVAVHDVGMMRYLGQRTTLDMVGLTTAGAADYWRHGPGAVGEFLLDHPPDYVAAYVDARGLRYLADTGLYGELLAGFEANYDPRSNVALGAPLQGIYRVDLTAAVGTDAPQQPNSLQAIEGFELMGSVNVADLTSEAQHDYAWTDPARMPGFSTEFYELDYIDCVGQCRVMDGGRRISGSESFTVRTEPGRDLLLISRVHPTDAGTIEVSVNDQPVTERWIPAVPGQWLEITTLIPSESIITSETRITIASRVEGGVYSPYYHWLYQGEYSQAEPESPPLAIYQDGALQLLDADLALDVDAETLTATFEWFSTGEATGDYIFFVHIYDALDQPPVAQRDARAGNGTLPPGNWLPGRVSDRVVVNLAQVPLGTYRVAIGFYDVSANTRLRPLVTSDTVEADEATQRLWIAEIRIPEDSASQP